MIHFLIQKNKITIIIYSILLITFDQVTVVAKPDSFLERIKSSSTIKRVVIPVRSNHRLTNEVVVRRRSNACSNRMRPVLPYFSDSLLNRQRSTCTNHMLPLLSHLLVVKNYYHSINLPTRSIREIQKYRSIFSSAHAMAFIASTTPLPPQQYARSSTIQTFRNRINFNDVHESNLFCKINHRQTRRFASESNGSRELSDNNITHSNTKYTNINNDDDNDKIIVREKTLQWVKQIVIGMNLCPFADRSYRLKQIDIDIICGCDEEKILSHVIDTMFLRESKPGTTLIVCPDLYPDDFNKYWDIAQFVEHGLLNDFQELQGVIQVAPFHPLFRFENDDNYEEDDNSEEDISSSSSSSKSTGFAESATAAVAAGDWTNRAPYPIFHILREEEVTLAVEKIDGDASRVWIRNVDLLNELSTIFGTNTFEQYMKLELALSTEQSLLLQQTLRRFRIQLSTPVTTTNENESSESHNTSSIPNHRP